ncbi:MAG: nucleoside kinase [Clostridia bacterium]|nr:nucleoside kinase [Clostridia bacterium]
MFLKINGIEMQCAEGANWDSLLVNLPDKGAGAVGISVRGRTHSLTEPAEEYAFARTLTVADEEGRRILERSRQLLFLTALKKVAPEAKARFEHSFGEGLYIKLINVPASEKLAAAVENEMKALTEKNLPLRRYEVTTEEARRTFAETGDEDRLRLLSYRQVPYLTLYEIDGVRDYYYGKMVPDTGRVGAFAVVAYRDGAVLLGPDWEHPDRPAKFTDHPKLFNIYAEMADWNNILNCTNAPDLNALIDNGGYRELIRTSEALQEKKIQAIADRFHASGARVLLIAGPSSSGKTTFANRMMIALRVLGLRPVKMSLDDYYLNRDTLPREADGSIDLERIDTLDTPLISEHLNRLLKGETVDAPTFDFKTGERMAVTHPVSVEPGHPIVIEGIHGLNDALTAGVPREMKFKVYISALTMLNLDDHNRIRTTDARLLRRIVRDYKFRGTLPEETMAMWDSVRNGEKKYIFPFQEEADAMFNSSMTYELPIMKKYAYPILSAVQPDSPHFTMARRLVKALNYIRTADAEDEVPINSLLREFIGGCCFYRDEE